MLTLEAAIALNRFGLGARPGDGRAVGSDPRGWLEEQLAPAKGGRRGTELESARVLATVRDLRVARQVRAQARAAMSPPGDEPPPTAPGLEQEAIREYARFIREHYVTQTDERHRLALSTDAPFRERLVHFWTNHFAVSTDKQPLGALAGLYEQEAIRPHVAGNFYDLLLAAVRHPAMILYLDNQASMGPASTAAGFVRRNRGRELGLNENLAREILELHTLGVDGGYTQADVMELAKVITGWSIGGPLGEGRGALARIAGDAGRPGEFHFRARMHEPGDKTVLGKRVRERGVEEGEEVLKMLALHESTGRHLAFKLARHFVADEPPVKLVERLADVYLRNDGDLPSVYRALIAANDSWREPLAKFKTPHDFVLSAYRALAFPADDLRPITAFLTQAGQRPYTPGSPAGWPDTSADWQNGDALLKRIELAAAAGRRAGTRIDAMARAAEVLGALGEHTASGIGAAADRGQALALLLAAPEFMRR